MYSTSNAFQWTQLVIITNILEKYYNVKTLAVSWTSMIFMVTYIPLIFPASWFLQKKVGWIFHLSIFQEKEGAFLSFDRFREKFLISINLFLEIRDGLDKASLLSYDSYYKFYCQKVVFMCYCIKAFLSKNIRFFKQISLLSVAKAS